WVSAFRRATAKAGAAGARPRCPRPGTWYVPAPSITSATIACRRPRVAPGRERQDDARFLGIIVAAPQHRHVARRAGFELVAICRRGLRVARGLLFLDFPAVPAPRRLRILAPERERRDHAGDRAAQVRL